MLVSSTLTGIFQVALYRFATGAPVPGFEPAQLQGSFRPRGTGAACGGFGGEQLGTPSRHAARAPSRRARPMRSAPMPVRAR